VRGEKRRKKRKKNEKASLNKLLNWPKIFLKKNYKKALLFHCLQTNLCVLSALWLPAV
jgi:uncharacterized iron-regulated protein